MTACSEEKGKSKLFQISLPKVTALALVSISLYQLTPDTLRIAKDFWTKASCRLYPPNGHLKQLGQQVPPLGPVPEITEWPEPEVFFKEYVDASKPVLFKGLAKTLPAFHKWTDEYLMKQFGHEEVAVETGLKQTDYGEHLYLNVMSEFLKNYKEKEIYLVDTVSPARFNDIVLPKSIRCGNFQNSLSDVIMWLSNGNTKSIIHNDYVDNINCILEGKKKMHLFKKDYTDKHRGDFSRSQLVDVDAVDLCEFPAYAQLPRYEIDVEAGDCLFLPFQWYHQVMANNVRNLGINFWFQHINWFNESECVGKDIGEGFKFGAQDMPTAATLRQYELLTFVQKERSFDLNKFFSIYLHEKVAAKENLTMLFNKADVDNDGLVSIAELYGVEANLFVSNFKEFGGLRFLNYTRDRGNLDPEDQNDTKPTSTEL